MTIAPERLEELDFPTPEVVSEELVGFERDGVIYTVPASEVAGLAEFYDGFCYCSPSRSMLMSRARAERAARRRARVAWGLFGLYWLTVLAFVLV